jgi:hypothetical protein
MKTSMRKLLTQGNDYQGHSIWQLKIPDEIEHDASDTQRDDYNPCEIPSDR